MLTAATNMSYADLASLPALQHRPDHRTMFTTYALFARHFNPPDVVHQPDGYTAFSNMLFGQPIATDAGGLLPTERHFVLQQVGSTIAPAHPSGYPHAGRGSLLMANDNPTFCLCGGCPAAPAPPHATGVIICVTAQ